MQYSLVIATFRDNGDLARCLSSIAGQEDAHQTEVVIVDQNGDDRLCPLVERFAGCLNLTHERVDFRNACRARNLGARLATGQWLGFPDDDCELLPATLREVSAIARDPRVKVVTGRTVDHEGRPSVLRWKPDPLEFDRWRMFGCLTEATLFVSRALFLAAGGFDERFGPGARFPAAEGIELMNRLFTCMGDGKACYSPRVVVRHPAKIPPWNRWAVGRFHEYATGDGALIAKCPQPHMLNWGLRTLASAALQLFSLNGWRSLAFTARIAGLLKGFIVYRLTSGRN